MNDENKNDSNEVTISDITIPFSRIVFIMVKWVIASIPALIILFMIGLIALLIFGGMLSAF